MMDGESPKPVGSTIQHISPKFPQFFEESPDMWFEVIEAQFELCNISSQRTKFMHTLCNLPSEHVTRLAPDVLSSKNFDSLKQAIKERTEKSKPELFDTLISTQILHGRPSDKLNEIIKIAHRLNIGDDLVRLRFIKMLPIHLHPIIISQKSLNLKQIGNLADELIAFSPPNSVYPTSQVSRTSPEIPQPPKTIAPRDPHKSLLPFYPNQRPRICRSHLYYADRARSCKHWCKYPNKPSNLNILPSSRSSSPVNHQPNSSNEQGN